MLVLKCKPIFLPTSYEVHYSEYIGFNYDKQIISIEEDLSVNKVTASHLYFVSDRHIFEGDRYINVSKNSFDLTNRAYTATKADMEFLINNPHSCKKVEATTDKKLDLPLIPQSFIDKFVGKKFNVNEVILDYTYEVFDRIVHYDKRSKKTRYSDDGSECNVLPNMNKILVKTRTNGTVIISRAEGGAYSIEDLEAAFNSGKQYPSFKEWYNTNY